MKKLLMLLTSLSFAAPVGMFVSESFSVNNNSTVATTGNAKQVDLTSSYMTGSTLRGGNYTAIESVENAGTFNGFTGQLTFGYNGKQVDIIKTKIDGTVISEKFFTADNDITAMLGRGNALVLFTASEVIKFDFSSQSDYIGKSESEDLFTATTQGSLDGSFGKVMTFAEYFGDGTLADGSNIYVLPQRNYIYIPGDRSGDELYKVSDADGSVKKSDESIFGNGTDLISQAYSFFFTGSDSNKNYWLIGKNSKYGTYGMLNLTSGSMFSPSFVSSDTGDTISTPERPMQTFDLGVKFGLALGTRVYMWNDDTKGDASNGKMTFEDKDCLFDSASIDGDKSNINYVTGVKDPNGNTVLLIGTEKGQYILRSNDSQGTAIGSDSSDVTLDNFTELDKIATANTTIASQSFSTAMSNSYGKIYVLDGTGNVHMWQRRILTGNVSSPDDNKPIKPSDIDKSKSNLDKAMMIRDQIESTVFNGTTSGYYISLADIVGSLEAQYNTSDLDSISDLTNFYSVEGELRQFTLEKGNIKWFDTSFSFALGQDASIEALEGLLANIQITDTFQFNAKLDAILKPIQDAANAAVAELVEQHTDWKDKVSIKITDITLPKGNGSFLQLGSNQYSISAQLQGLSADPETYTDGKATFTNVTAIDLSMDKTEIKTTKSTSITINGLADVNAYDENQVVSASITTAVEAGKKASEDDAADNTATNGLHIKATDLATGKDISDVIDKYVSVSIDGDKLKVEYTKEKYSSNIDLEVAIDTSGAEAANEYSTPITIHMTYTFTNWAMIGGIIGGVLGAAILGVLIFAFIKWWYPMIVTRVPNKNRGNSKAYNRRPQETADANSVRHARKHQIRRASAYSDKSIVRSGIFNREIDVNEEKFKNPNRKDEFLGYDLDEEAVVNNWSSIKDEEATKRPRISYEKKSKVEAHEKEVAKKMADKKRELNKGKKN